MANPKYKRILIKLSGEALAGERGVGIDIQTVQTIAKEIQEVHSLGIEIALVIGGGNLWRGEPAAEAGMDLSLIHISEPTRRRGISYAVFCLKKKK